MQGHKSQTKSPKAVYARRSRREEQNERRALRTENPVIKERGRLWKLGGKQCSPGQAC